MRRPYENDYGMIVSRRVGCIFTNQRPLFRSEKKPYPLCGCAPQVIVEFGT